MRSYPWQSPAPPLRLGRSQLLMDVAGPRSRPEADGTGQALDAAFPLLSRSKLRRPQVPRILESCPGKVGLIRLRAIADVLS